MGDSCKTILVRAITKWTGPIMGIVLLFTLFLIYPMFRMAPSMQASPNPSGEVFELQEEINDKFPNSIHFTPFLMESPNGDVLTPGVLSRFKQHLENLFEMDLNGDLAAGSLENQPYLVNYLDPDLGILMQAAHSILDPINSKLLDIGVTIEEASTEEIKLAVHRLISNPQTTGVLDFLSRHASYEPKDVNGEKILWWVSPATTFSIMTDNQKLGGGGLEIGVGGEPDVINKEHLNRRIKDVLIDDEGHYDLWGIAIDANLEAQDEGESSGVYIMVTVICALLVIGFALKSYWATAICGIGLGILMIWLKGISALIGLKSGLVIDLIVPISMISLGADFAIHALRRYKEEKNNQYTPRIALTAAITGVLGALVLAMLTDSIAFLSNLSSSIEAVIHFGSAAAIAVFASFIILGIIAPMLLMKVDELADAARFRSTGKAHLATRITGSIGVAVASSTAIILMVAVSKLVGVITLGATTILFLCLPIAYLVAKQRIVEKSNSHQLRPDRSIDTNLLTIPAIEFLVIRSVRHPILVLGIAALITSISIFFAVKLEPVFDVKDFYDSESEMVIGLNQLDEHVGKSGGEPGVVYVRGDLVDPNALKAISNFIESLRDIDHIAETPSGRVTAGLNVVDVSQFITDSPFTIASIKYNSGVQITDSDLDGIPDTRQQLEAGLRFAVEHGVLGAAGLQILMPGQIKQAIYLSENGEHVTGIWFQIPGTRDQSVVTATEQSIQPALIGLEAHPSIYRVGLSGSPFTRKAQLSASTQTLYTSLPIALVAAVVLLSVTMRSVRYATVTVLPIVLVVAWLYAIMYAWGFALNFVTAMIGAISIGIGVDYSIHMTQRFREESRRVGDVIEAMKSTASGTGVALVGSAASSVIGFAILGFAPMPMFAAYGLLTAVMIFLALIASLVVLPCLLAVVTDTPKRGS